MMKRNLLLKISSLLILAVIIFPLSGYSMSRKPKTFPVYLKVDFGPAGKPYYANTVIVEKGMTAKEAVSQAFPIQTGKACCSVREILSIDGVKIDPAKNRWWVAELNGSKKFSPHKKKLKSGDTVTWKYIEEVQ
jgi:hypothetical protein